MQKAYIQKVPVTRKGQKVSFQIKLPNDFKKLMSMEVTHFFPTMVTSTNGQYKTNGNLYARYNSKATRILLKSILLGELKLQVADSSNIFFTEDLFIEDYSLVLNDFARSGYWTGRWWTHGMQREPYYMEVCGSNTVINGYFTDRFMTQPDMDNNSYEVRIYLWYESTKGQ